MRGRAAQTLARGADAGEKFRQGRRSTQRMAGQLSWADKDSGRRPQPAARRHARCAGERSRGAKAHQAVNTAPLLLIVVRWRGGGGAAGGPSLRRRCAESAVMCTTPGEPLCSMRAAAPRRGSVRLEQCAWQGCAPAFACTARPELAREPGFDPSALRESVNSYGRPGGPGLTYNIILYDI